MDEAVTVNNPEFSLRLSPGDVLKLTVPGATVLIVIVAWEALARNAASNVEASQQAFVLSAAGDALLSWLQAVSDPFLTLAAVVMAAAVAYMVGHVVASFGSLFLERALVLKGMGYPYAILLRLRDSEGQKDARSQEASRAVWRGLFLWGNLGCFLFYVGLAFPGVSWFGLSVAGISLWILAIWSLLLVTKVVVSAMIRYLRHRPDKRSTAVKAEALLGGAAAGFWDILLNPLIKTIGIKTPLPEEAIGLYDVRFRKEFGVDASTAGTHNFWFPYIWMIGNAPALAKVTHRGRIQYQFTRNLSAALYLVWAYALVWWMTLGREMEFTIGSAAVAARWLPILALTGSAVMLIRYVYLWLLADLDG